MKFRFCTENNLSPLFILFNLLCAFSIYSQNLEVRFSDQAGKYGFKNKKTGTWIAPPVYDHIEPVYTDDVYNAAYYEVRKNNNSYLLDKHGKQLLSQPFRKIERKYNTPVLFVVINNNKRFILVPGKPMVEFQNTANQGYYYDRIGRSFSLFRVFAHNNKKEIQLYNWRNNKLYPEKYDSVYHSDGFIFVRNKKWGIINEDGKVLLPNEYDAFSYKNHLLLARKQNKWGALDSTLNIKLAFEYDSLACFTTIENNELSYNYYVKKNGRVAIQNREFENIIPFDFDEIKANNSFSDLYNQASWQAKKDGKWGVINFKNEWLIPCKYDWIYPDNLEGLLNDDLYRWDTTGTLPVVLNKKMGILTLSGKELFPFKYDYCLRIDRNFASPSKEKMYFVNNGCKLSETGEIEGGKWGITDSSGKIILPLEYEMVPVFKSEYNDENNPMDSTLHGFILNSGGKKLVTCDTAYYELSEYFDEMGNPYYNDHPIKYFSHLCSNNFFKGGLFGYCERSGKVLIPAIYDDIRLPMHVRVYCGSERNTEKTQHISIKDSINLPYNKPHAYYTLNQPVFVKKNGKWGSVARNGALLIPIEHDSLSYEENSIFNKDSASRTQLRCANFIKTFTGKKYGFFCEDGKKVCDNAIEREIPLGPLRRADTSNSMNYIEEWNSWSIVAQDVTERIYLSYSLAEVAQYDESGNADVSVATQTSEFSLPVKAKYNIKDDGRQLLLNKEWFDDIILVHSSGNPFFPTRISDRLKLEINFPVDSIIEKGGRKIYKMGDKGFENSRTYNWEGSFMDYYFVKRSGKWYVHNIALENVINEGAGFDSIVVSSDAPFSYKAYTGSSFARYGLFFRGPFNQHADAFLPDTIQTLKIAYRGKEIKYRDYVFEEKQKLFDLEGQERDTVIRKIVSLPVAGAGKFNLIKHSGAALLNDWADEIIFPKNDKGDFISISNESSFIYQNENALSSLSAINHFNAVKSFTVRYGEDWFLAGMNGAMIGPFKVITQMADKWMCGRKKKNIYHSIHTLQIVE